MSEEKSLMNRMEYLFAEKEEILFSSNLLEKNNKVVISGVIEKNFEFSHSLLSENFYFTRVGVEKNSGVEDLVPIMVSNLFFDGKDGIESDLAGEWVGVWKNTEQSI